MTDVPAPVRRRPEILAALLAFLVWLPTLQGAFLYDDLRMVVANRAIRDLSDLGTVVRSDPARPLLALTFALNYHASGLTPWPWHLVNVILHAGTAALVAAQIRALGRGRPDAERAALLGGGFFAVTPMAADAVAYVASRSTGLSAFLTLAALAVVRPALESSVRRPARIAGGLVLFVLALAVKEEAAALPLFLLLLDLQGVAGGDLRAVWTRRAVHAPFVLLPAAGLLARRALTGAWWPEPWSPLPAWLVTQAAEFPLYLLRAFVPLDPSFFRGIPLATWLPPFRILAGLALLGMVVGATVRSLRRQKPMTAFAFAVLWMAMGLLPSSSLLPLKEPSVDRRAYVGGLGVALVVGQVLAAPGRGVFAAAMLLALAGRAVLYERVLADPVRAWQDAVTGAPASVEAYLGLAEAQVGIGNLAEAERALSVATKVAPRDPRAWSNLATFYVDRSRLRDAADAMQRAVALAPRDARLRDNMGLIYDALGQRDRALAELEAAVRGDPPLAQPRIDLARAVARGGDRERARRLLEEAATLEVDARAVQEIEALRAQLDAP